MPVDDTKKEERTILQGGEDIASAVAISALPYNDFGTTLGYINDYDEACPGGTGTAGDVVYSYTPPVDQYVTISLCGSSFDTKLIVYANDYTPGSPFACDDDACPVGLQSELIGLGLTAGVPYYIVVDGYGANEGDYTIDVFETPPPPGCPADGVIFGQVPTVPSEAWTFAVSDLEPNYTRYESFVNFYGEVNEIHFWGIDAYNDGSAWTECDEDPASIEIKFYADNNGLPGAVQATYDVSITPVATGQDFGTLPYQQKEYVATISPAYTMYEGWISIQGISSGDNCWFLWQNSLNGADGQSLLFDGTTYTAVAYDLSMCLIGNPRTPWLSIDNPHLEIPIGGNGTITANMSAVNLTAGTYHGNIELSTNDPDESALNIPVTFIVTGGGGPGCHYVVGDINGNGALNGIDVTYGVSYFKGGNLPPYSCECTPGNTWFVAGDVNGSCVFNGIDITYLVSYFKGGAAPHGCASCLPTMAAPMAPSTPALAPTKVGNIDLQQ
jgi:hypothetical protein